MRGSEVKRDDATGGNVHQETIRKYDTVSIRELQKMQFAYRRAYISSPLNSIFNYLNYKYEWILNKIASVASMYSFGSVLTQRI